MYWGRIGLDKSRLTSLIAPLLIGVIISYAGRLVSDALHVPGFYDLTGVVFAASFYSLPLAIVSSVVIPLSLTLYYSVYLIAFPVYVIAGITYWLLTRKLDKYSPLYYVVVPLLYSTLWLLLYALFTHTIVYYPIYLRMKGFYVLLVDGFLSILIARALARGYRGREGIELTRMNTLFTVAVLVIAIASYIGVYVNEWGITTSFPERSGWTKYHTKMDFVWLPLGEKGINNYYIPDGRYDKGSPEYQVWVGMYWVQGRHDITDVGLVSEFAIWDQNFWLGIHGASNPYTYVDLVENISEYEFMGHRAYLMYGGMVSLSDVPPYEEVKLRGFFITFYDEKADRTGIFYACATEENYAEMYPVLWCFTGYCGVK